MFMCFSIKKNNETKKNSASKKNGVTKKGNQGSFEKAKLVLMKKKYGEDTPVKFKSPRNTFDIDTNQITLERQLFNFGLSKKCEK